MSNRPVPSLETMAAKIRARIEFHACDTLVFLRPDGALDSTPVFSVRAGLLKDDGAVRQAGYKLVGTYRPGVTLAQLLADARAAA